MPIENVLASVAVRDLNAAGRWYESIFGRPPDSRAMPEVLEWKFNRGGCLQVYQLPERAGAGSFTLAVTDIDETVRRLNALGVDAGSTISSDRVKTVMIKDPDGNSIAFAQALDPDIAH